MKRLLLIASCLIFGTSFYAQDYIPFPDSVATWNAFKFSSSETSSSESMEGTNYHMEGDTLINDTLYSKLYVRNSWLSSYVSGPNPQSIDTNYSHQDHPYILIGGIREDEEKKVWYRNINFDNWGNNQQPYPWYFNKFFGDFLPNSLLENVEILLYDFNTEIGSTVYFNDGNCASALATLDTIIVDVLDRRNYVFVAEEWDGEEIVWVEGIGDITSDPFSRFDIAVCLGLGFDVGKELACFWENDEQIYSSIDNTTADCEGLILVGIDEFEKQSLEIYPNPSDGRFVISLPAYFDFAQHDLLLVVYNSLGDEVFSEMNFLGNRIEIDLSDFPNGIYMVFLETEGGSYSSKIIKE